MITCKRYLIFCNIYGVYLYILFIKRCYVYIIRVLIEGTIYDKKKTIRDLIKLSPEHIKKFFSKDSRDSERKKAYPIYSFLFLENLISSKTQGRLIVNQIPVKV